MSTDAADRRDVTPAVQCRSYTSARRFPLVIGRIAGWSLPTPISPTQLIVFVTSLATLLVTRPMWSWAVGGSTTLLVMAVPVAAAWAVRSVRLEGRAPLRMALALAASAAAPRHGTSRGRRVRHPAPRHVRTSVVALHHRATPAPATCPTVAAPTTLSESAATPRWARLAVTS